MAGKSGTKTVKARVVPNDLDAVMREALRTAPGLKSSQLKKALPPPYQAYAKEAQAALLRLVQQGEAYRFINGKTEIFFERDPQAALDDLVPRRLSADALGKGALKAMVEEIAQGVFESWFKSALTRGLIFEHAARPPSKEKRYGNQPDLAKSLDPVLTVLRKALLKTDAQGIARERVANALLGELGLSLPPPPVGSNGAPRNHAAHEPFLAGLRGLVASNPGQALLSIRDLRARVALGKEEFDAVALDLMREGKVSLHHHDHPASLPEPERSQLVQDARGNYYIGIAPGQEE